MSWRDVSDDQICEYTGSRDNPEVVRYERILQVRLREMILQLTRMLQGVNETIYHGTGRLSDKADELLVALHTSTERMTGAMDGLRQSYESIGQSQGRQQAAIIALTIVIAVATAGYTWITWKSVQEMRVSNAIQQQMLSISQQTNTHQQSKK